MRLLRFYALLLYLSLSYISSFKEAEHDKERKRTRFSVTLGKTKARSRYRCRCGKTTSIKYHECASVFMPWLSDIQIASFLGRVILPSVACLALSYFSILSFKRHDIREKKLLNIKCVNFSEIRTVHFWLHRWSPWFVSCVVGKVNPRALNTSISFVILETSRHFKTLRLLLTSYTCCGVFRPTVMTWSLILRLFRFSLPRCSSRLPKTTQARIQLIRTFCNRCEL